MNVAPGQAVVAHDSTATEVFDEGEFTVVVYESRSGAVQRLGAAAAAVWLAIDGVSTIEQIVADLSVTFDESVKVIGPVVSSSLENFWDAGLLDGSRAIEAADGVQHLDFVLPRPPDP